jgi:hypothetical protein
MPGRHPLEFLTIRVAAVYFVKTTWRVTGSPDDRSPCENIVHERSGLGTIKQASAGFGFQTNDHGPSLYGSMKTSNQNRLDCQ